MLIPLGVWEKGRSVGEGLEGGAGAWWQLYLKHSFLLVNYHDFTLVIGPIAVAENNVESHGRVGEGREGRVGALGQLFLETELPIDRLP
jgi:hypothetical protein